MFTKIKRKIKRSVDKISRTPSVNNTPVASSSVSINNSGATSAPVPAASISVSVSGGLLAPPHPSSQTGRTSVLQSAPASPLTLSANLPAPVSQNNTSGSPAVQSGASIQIASATSIMPPGPERSVKSTAWSGLKTLFGLLNQSADAFPPLKSAIGGILGCIEIYERLAQGREDYKKLGEELDSLFKELTGFLGGPTPPTMTPSLENLAKGIEKEIMFVLGKNERNKLERIAEAMEDPDAILECYRRIQCLLERFSLNANLNVWKTVDEQTTELRLKGLSPSHSARYDPPETTKLRRNGCMPGTRVEVLDKLKAWAENSKSENIYWLNGMAGTGKTTIAYSFCDQLKSSLALAASFFCSRQVKECRDVNLILPTLAYQLARFSRPFQHHLSKAIEKDPDIHTRKIPEQFQKLIVEPLLKSKDTIPLDLVVVIDALDECDNKGGVCQILGVFLSHSTQLPLKFFVTSRPEPRILDQMKDGPNRNVPASLYLHDIERSIVSEDIRTYLK
ncbi:hypothetical protein BDV93DRAFT_585628, partial [Ceratobasidium sp. AG-I]